MAHLTCWEFTELPVEIIDVVERDIKKFDDEVEDSNLTNNVVDKSIRDRISFMILLTLMLVHYNIHTMVLINITHGILMMM